MTSNDLDAINEINFTKRCILMSVIAQEKNIVLINSFHKIPIVKLFTADSTFENFVYSKIRGAFCLFMNKEKDPKNRKYYFRIYDLNDYSLLFNMEVKKEYMQYITQYKEDFYFMELRQSFLGFQFLSKESGRLFFLLLNEDPKKEIIEQNEGSMNIKPKDISKTTTKVIDYIKMKLKYKFESSGAGGATIYSRRREAPSQKKENFQTMNINDSKGEYFETSIILEIELLIDNIEIDDVDSSVLLFTEKDLDYEKCQKIVKKYENNMENTVRRRNAQNIPITIIDKDCKSILNKKTYVEIMVKNILNNLRMQKRLDIFMQEHKKRHKGAQIGGGRRKTRGRLSKVVKRDSRLSNLSKMGSERSSYADSYSEDKNRRFSYNTNPALKFKNNQSSSNKPITNNISTNIKMNAKSVDKENKGRFAKDKRKINAMQTTEMFGGMDDDDEGDLDKGGFNYFTNDDKNKIKQNNISKDVDIIEERPEDEEKEREYKYKKREIRLPNKYITNINTNNNKTNNITTNNIRTNNITTNNIRTNNITTNNIKTTNNTTTTNNASSRANVYKRPIASKGGKASMSSFLMGTGKK
jgi:hypothetical protein